jgi:hypothetical protein
MLSVPKIWVHCRAPAQTGGSRSRRAGSCVAVMGRSGGQATPSAADEEQKPNRDGQLVSFSLRGRREVASDHQPPSSLSGDPRSRSTESITKFTRTTISACKR